ncbi:LamG-like jellyroll fold domain-containing protein [Verrucomicrobiaceae bacterium 227]
MKFTTFSLLAFTPFSLQASEVLHFSMEEASTPIVDQVGSIQALEFGTGHNYSLAGPAGFGNAVALTSSGSWRFSLEDSLRLRNLANNFSVTAWIYLDSATLASKTGLNNQLNRIVGDDEAWDADGWSIGVWNDGRVRFTKNGIVDIDLGEVGAVPTDEWVHVAATVSSADGSKLFVNGVPVGSNGNLADCNPGVGNNGVLDLWGLGRAYGEGEEQWFGGRMDEVHIFDHVLTEGEVADLMVVDRDPALVTNLLVVAKGHGAEQTINLFLDNDGETENLTITGVSFIGPDADDFAGGILPGAIAPAGTAPLPIIFTPSRGGGDYLATAVITSNDPRKSSFEVMLEVTVTDPSISTPPLLDFGTLAAAAGPIVQAVEVSNEGGNQELTISNVSVSGEAASSFTVGILPSPFTIAPGATASFEVTFDGSDRVGSFAASLDLSSNDLGNPVASIPLTAQVDLGNLNDYLVSHFTFDSALNLGDDRGSFNLDGTVFGDATMALESKVGTGALLLDGDSDGIEVGGGAQYSSLDDDLDGFTVAAWICPDASTTGDRRIFSTYMPGTFTAEGWGVGINGPTGDVLLGTAFGRLDYTSSTAIFPALGEWHHVAYVYRGNPVNQVEFFLDGVSVGLTTTASATEGMIDTALPFAIGGIGIDGNPQSFFGKIDDLRIYRVELEAADILEVSQAVGGGELAIFALNHSGSSLTITWNSVPGRFYEIERSYDDPETGQEALVQWEQVNSGYEATGETSSFTDPLLPSASRVFYRVGEVVPR